MTDISRDELLDLLQERILEDFGEPNLTVLCGLRRSGPNRRRRGGDCCRTYLLLAPSLSPAFASSSEVHKVPLDELVALHEAPAFWTRWTSRRCGACAARVSPCWHSERHAYRELKEGRRVDAL